MSGGRKVKPLSRLRDGSTGYTGPPRVRITRACRQAKEGPARAGPSHDSFAGGQIFGMITVSMTWITPLVAEMSAETTLASLTITPLVALTAISLP